MATLAPTPRAVSPAGSNSTTTTNQLEAYTFGRTPSLHLELPPAVPNSLPFPSTSAPTAIARPPLERQASNVSSTSTVSNGANFTNPPRRFELPPGLADSPLPSTNNVNASLHQLRQARGPRIDYEPPIPQEIYQILLTTSPPPPPPSRSNLAAPPLRTPAVSFPPVSGSSDWRFEGRSSLLKRVRALTLRSNNVRTTEVTVPIVPQSEVLDLKKTKAERRNKVEAPWTEAPTSWKEYESLYATGRVDIEEPPFPPLTAPPVPQVFPSPSRSASRPLPFANITPYDLAHFPAPLQLSSLSPIRERLIAALDLLGRFVPDQVPLLPSSPPSHYAPSPTISHVSASYSIASSASTHRDSLFQSIQGHPRRPSASSTAPSTLHFPTKGSSSQYPPPLTYRSVQNLPALVHLVDHLVSIGLQTTNNPHPPRAASITLFPVDSSVASVDIVASSGLGPDASKFPIEFAIDAHTILNGSKGLVVNDLERDWRWRGNRLMTEDLGVRFYAGMPIFAPSSLTLPGFSVAQYEEEAGGSRIAIGVLAIMDDRPKNANEFGSVERAKLRTVSSEVTAEIERFVLERAAVVLASTPRRGSAASTAASTFHSGIVPAPASGLYRDKALPPPPPLTSSFTAFANPFPHSHPQKESPRRPSRRIRGHAKKVSFDANIPVPISPAFPPPPPSAPSSSSALPQRNHLPSENASREPPPTTTSDSPTSFSDPDFDVPSLFHSHPPDQLLSLACQSLSKHLNLSLVYLVELTSLPHFDGIDTIFVGGGMPKLELIASFGLPVQTTGASFDPMLHLKSLRAPEGGLLYRSSSSTSNDDQRGGGEPFDSGMLLPVLEIEGGGGNKGWVIAGYAKQRDRRWGRDEMEVFERVTQGVAKVLLWREEWLVDSSSSSL